jgi:hypothetical protein
MFQLFDQGNLRQGRGNGFTRYPACLQVVIISPYHASLGFPHRQNVRAPDFCNST